MYTSHAHIRSQHNRVWPHMSFVRLSTRVHRFLSKCGCIPQWSPSVLGRMKRCSSTYVHDYCPRRSVCHTVRIQCDLMFFLALVASLLGTGTYSQNVTGRENPEQYYRMYVHIYSGRVCLCCAFHIGYVKVCAHKFGATKCKLH